MNTPTLDRRRIVGYGSLARAFGEGLARSFDLFGARGAPITRSIITKDPAAGLREDAEAIMRDAAAAFAAVKDNDGPA
ncbi:MAG: hypothetical protein WCQ50_01250 [Spirochaetota bacterium]